MDITFDQWWSLLSEEQKKDVFKVYQGRLGQRFDTKMGIQEQEALARQLFELHEEALGEPHSWPDLLPEHREAWIQVAQFVIQRDSKSHDPVQVVSGYDEPVSKDTLMSDEEFRKWLSNQGGKSSPRFA